jgi:hypothetical protein
VQLQPDFGHPCVQRGKDLLGLLFCRAVHHSVVGLCRGRDYADLVPGALVRAVSVFLLSA